MPEIQAEMPKDLRLKWGVSPYEYDPKAQTFELYAIRSTERNGKAPLEGDVVVSAKDEYDHYGKPAVSMSMNTDGARRWLSSPNRISARASLSCWMVMFIPHRT